MFSTKNMFFLRTYVFFHNKICAFLLKYVFYSNRFFYQNMFSMTLRTGIHTESYGGSRVIDIGRPELVFDKFCRKSFYFIWRWSFWWSKCWPIVFQNIFWKVAKRLQTLSYYARCGNYMWHLCAVARGDW